MAVVVMSHRLFGKLQFSFDLASFFVCLMLSVVQQSLLDYYFVHYTHEKHWLWLVVADAAVVAVMIWLVIFALKHNRRSMNECCTEDADLPYAYLVWAIYSIVLSVKIALIYRLFAEQIAANRETFGIRTLQLILSLSAIVFLFLVLSHHYTTHNSPRQTYLNYLSSTVSFDVIDSVSFLQLLTNDATKQSLNEETYALKHVILFFACFNFVLPTFALLKLRYSKRFPIWMPLPDEKMYGLLYYLSVNAPYLAIRCYIWGTSDTEVSAFIIKNIIMVLLGVRELWLAILYWKQKKGVFCRNIDKNTVYTTSSTRESSASSSRIFPLAWNVKY